WVLGLDLSPSIPRRARTATSPLPLSDRFARLQSMKLDDAALREAVARILARHPGSGLPRIRQSLRDQFGFACGTDRLRRMLRAVRTVKNEKPAQADGPTGASTDLSEALSIAQQEVLQWKERAERAEAREIAHQSRWAQEI